MMVRNLEHYRLDVHLRWADLESLRRRNTPLKINLQKLRRVHTWPVCDLYDSPQVFGEDGIEIPSRTSGQGYANTPGEAPPKTNPTDDDVCVYVIRRRKASKPKLGLDLRFCEIESVGDDESEVGVFKDAVPIVKGPSRGFKRAVKNNQHLDKKISDLNGFLESRRRLLSKTKDPQVSLKIKDEIKNLHRQINSCRNSYSTVDGDQAAQSYNAFRPPPEPPGPRKKEKPPSRTEGGPVASWRLKAGFGSYQLTCAGCRRIIALPDAICPSGCFRGASHIVPPAPAAFKAEKREWSRVPNPHLGRSRYPS